MCGINGIFAFDSAVNPVDRTELARTRDHMAARGPDGKGEWISCDERVGFGHRRLSIIDLSDAGAQPMASSDGSLVVTFNGEIYNYRELRKALEAKGHTFHSHSDTEVLLHLYAEMGEAMVGELRGMFAFAIWDVQRRQLFLARDPYGIKPLYYANDGRTFRFASQVKALLAGGALSREIDPSGLVGFYMLGSVPEPLTIYSAVRALSAGHSLRVYANGQVHSHRFHGIASVYRTATDSGLQVSDGPERQIRARHALLDSVQHHLVADVPVGAFLSAGIDSCALVGLMRDALQSEIETVTLSFEEFRGTANDEAPLAEEIARIYGTRHTTRIVTRAEFEADLPLILAAMDQPSIDGINSWFVAKAARECGLKVAISGVGGDELFGGYPSFREIPRWVNWLRWPAAIPGLGAAVRRAVVALCPSRLRVSPKTAGLLEYGGEFAGAWLLRRGLFMPWELTRLFDPEVLRQGLAGLNPLAAVRSALEPMPTAAFERVATMEAALYMRNQLLRDTDWASMAHSLEVRTPLVDATLLGKIATLGPPSASLPAKHDLAMAPSQPLPQALLARKKTGFGVPVGAWMARAEEASVPTSPISGKVTPYAYTRDWARSVAHLQTKSVAPTSAAA